MRCFVGWFILVAPFLILLGDALIWRFSGEGDTITGVVREWQKKSVWPEVIYLVAVFVLWAHLFRNCPERWMGIQ